MRARVWNGRVAAASGASGFTLIELMVSISIISLLIAVLLPALTTARAVARSATCASQLRQINIATHTYAHDHQQWLPYAYTEGGSFSGNAAAVAPAWYVQLAPYVQVRARDFYRLGGPAAADLITGPVVFSDPEDDLVFPTAIPVSYAPLSYNARYAPNEQRGHLDDVVNPSTKVWVLDSESPYAVGGAGLSVASSQHPLVREGLTRHAGTYTNTAYFDGSVRPLLYEVAIQTPPNQLGNNPYRAYQP